MGAVVYATNPVMQWYPLWQKYLSLVFECFYRKSINIYFLYGGFLACLATTSLDAQPYKANVQEEAHVIIHAFPSHHTIVHHV